jgi:opacity protein-like surface antigen
MERSGNFYKAIRLGYILISILIGCMAYNSLYEWQEIEALELGNKKIDELRKEINNINIQMIKFSLLGETILEWNDKDIEHYHARRMAYDIVKTYEEKSTRFAISASAGYDYQLTDWLSIGVNYTGWQIGYEYKNSANVKLGVIF